MTARRSQSEEIRDLINNFGEAAQGDSGKVGHAHGALLSALDLMVRQKARRDRHIKKLEAKIASLQEQLDDEANLDGMDNNDALQIICRAFQDWEPIWDEWLEWYGDGKGWFHMSRGLGAFLSKKISPREPTEKPAVPVPVAENRV